MVMSVILMAHSWSLDPWQLYTRVYISVYIDIFGSDCSVINYGRGFVRLDKRVCGRKLDRFLHSRDLGGFIHSRRPGGLQRPYSSVLSDLLQDGILLPAFVDDHNQ